MGALSGLLLAATTATSPAHAATLYVDLGPELVQVRLDGRRLLFDGSGSRVVVVEAVGAHRVTVHPVFGRTELGGLDVDLPSSGVVRVVWRGGALGVVKDEPAPPLAIPASAVHLTVDRASGKFRAPVRLAPDAEPVLLFVDTAATHTLLCEKHLSVAGFVAAGTVETVTGGTAAVPLSWGTVPSIELFGTQLRDATVQPSSTCDLEVVGILALQNFNLVAVAGQLWVWRGEPAPSGASALRRDAPTGVWAAEVAGPRGAIFADVDTGSPTTFMAREDAVLIGAVATGERYSAPTIDGPVSVERWRVETLTVVGRVMHDVDVYVSADIAPGQGIIGMNVLSQLELRLSSAGLWLLDPATSDLVRPPAAP